MQKQNEQVEQQLDIEITEEVAEGVYSNLVMIAHSQSEFVLDFIKILPGLPKAKVKSRVILTPEHAHRLQAALADNIRKYEDNFGDIRNVDGANYGFPMQFSGPMGEA